MVSVVVCAFVDTDEGYAALSCAIVEAQLRSSDLLICHVSAAEAESHDIHQVMSERILQRLSDSLEPLTWDLVIRSGREDPVREIINIIEDKGAELLVIGHRRRSSWSSVFWGNTSQQLLDASQCPVLTVKASAGYGRHLHHWHPEQEAEMPTE